MSITIKPEVVTNTQADQVPGDLVGYVHSSISGGAVDGPGMRFVLFVTGCQMRCLYCHNPDTWRRRSGDPKTVDEIVEQVRKIASFIKATGGITISGGEPLVQAEFVHEIFRQCKEKFKLHTALDTNGLLAANLPDEWFDVVDLVMLDIKHINPDKHQALTHAPLQPVLDFAKRLERMGKPAWVRYVLVPGWTDSEETVDEMADYVATLSNVERVEVLPFHKMGEYKWEELGMTYELSDTQAPEQAVVDRVKAQFEKRGLKTTS